MRTARTTLGILVSVISWGCSEHVPPEVVSEAEYAVYSAAVEQLFLVGWGGPPTLEETDQVTPGEIVLLSPTIASSHDASAAATGLDINLEEELNHALTSLQRAWPPMERGTVDDFRRKNVSRTQLEDRFEVGVPFTIVQEEGVDHIFSPNGGWHAF